MYILCPFYSFIANVVREFIFGFVGLGCISVTKLVHAFLFLALFACMSFSFWWYFMAICCSNYSVIYRVVVENRVPPFYTLEMESSFSYTPLLFYGNKGYFYSQAQIAFPQNHPVNHVPETSQQSFLYKV